MRGRGTGAAGGRKCFNFSGAGRGWRACEIGTKRAIYAGIEPTRAISRKGENEMKTKKSPVKKGTKLETVKPLRMPRHTGR